MAKLKPSQAVKPAAGAAAGAAKVAPISAELAAAVAALTAQPSCTAAPFITAMQKEADARAARRHTFFQAAKWMLIAASVVVALHVGVTRFLYQAPTETANASPSPGANLK